MSDPKNEEPDHEFQGRIVAPENDLPSFLCHLWLPKELGDDPALRFSVPSDRRHAFVALSTFDMEGEVRDFEGEVQRRIRITQVFTDWVPSRHVDPETIVTEVQATPTRVEVVDYRGPGTEEPERVGGEFMLTPFRDLGPLGFLFDASPTGEIRVEGQKRCVAVELTESDVTHFDWHFTYEKQDQGATLRRRHLVAVLESGMTSLDMTRIEEKLLPRLDLVLKIASIAGRRRCVCFKWRARDRQQRLTVYRGNVAKPDNPLETDDSNPETLVRRPDIQHFLTKGLSAIDSLPDTELVATALASVPRRATSTLEADFLQLFAALEALLLWYRRKESLEFIVEEHEWDKLRADLQKMLSSWAKGRDAYKDKTRRRCLYAKIGELNRVPLTDAFEEFKQAFSIDLDDLWPLFGTEGAVLSGIRNRIIHGDRFGPQESPALIISLDNLRWTVERTVLGVLGWPVERSTVSPRYLAASGLTAYDWQRYVARIGT